MIDKKQYGNFDMSNESLTSIFGISIKDHIHIVSHETRNLHRRFTSFLVVSVWLIQILIINGSTRLGLNFMAGSLYNAKLFVVITIACPSTILLLGVFFMRKEYREKRYSFESINTRSYKEDKLFKVYIGLLRLNFFIVEPLATGYLLTLIPTGSLKYSLRDEIGLNLELVMIIPTLIGFVQSIIYSLFIESILPNDHILSCSSNTDILLINIAIKSGIFMDSIILYVYSKGLQRLALVALLIARNACSLFAIYLCLRRSFYFHSKGKLIYMGLHGSFIGLSLLSFTGYFRDKSNSDQYFIVPGLVLGSLWLKFGMNFIQRSSVLQMDPDKCQLNSVLHLAQSYYQAFKSNSSEALNVDGVRVSAQIRSYLAKRSVEFERYRFAYTKSAEDSESIGYDFVMFLFHKLTQRDKQRSLKALVYQVYYINRLGIKLHLTTSLLADIGSRPAGIFMKSQIECLRAMVTRTTCELYTNRLRLDQTDARFYRAGQDSLVEAKERSVYRGPRGFKDIYSDFDIYGCLLREQLRENMIQAMGQGIQKLLAMYQKIAKKTLVSIDVHNVSRYMLDTERSISLMFNKIEHNSSFELIRPSSHLLPYAMFVNSILCQRHRMSDVLKLYRERVGMLNRYQRRSCLNDLVSVFQLENMLLLTVSAQKSKLGGILYSTKNINDLFPQFSLKLIHISKFFSQTFKNVHSELIDDFLVRQDSDYFGIQRHRFIRTDNFGHFEPVEALVKLGPTLCNQNNISFCCLLSKVTTSAGYLFVSPASRICGFNWNLQYFFPQIVDYMEKDVGLLSPDLKALIDKEMTATIRSMDETQKNEEKMRKNLKSMDKQTQDLERVLFEDTDSGDLLTSIIIRNSVYGTILLNEVKVHVQPVKASRIERRVMLHDIVIKVSADSLAALNKDHDSNSLASKQVISKYFKRKPRHQVSLLDQKAHDVDNHIQENSKTRLLQTAENEMLNYLSKNGRIEAQGEPSLPIRTQDQDNMNEIQIRLASEVNFKIGFQNSKSTVSTDFKNRVFTMINRKKRYFVWRELVFIALVQLIIWATAIYVTIILDKNYNIQMQSSIELRRGVWFFALANAKLINTFTANFEFVMEKKGLLDPERYRKVLPKLTRDWMSEGMTNLRQSEHYSRLLIKQIYSFEAAYAYRYLQFKARYTTEIGESLKQNFTGTYDVNEMYYLAYASIRRWYSNIGRLDLNDTNITELYEIMGVGILGKIGLVLLNTLTDSDVDVFVELTNQTITTMLISIVSSLLLANAVIILVLIVRNKMITVYSAFSKLYDFEVVNHTDFLNKMVVNLKMSLKKVKDFELELFSHLREQQTAVLTSGDIKQRKPTQRKNKVYTFIFGDFFGFGYFVGLIFVLMEAYNLTVYIQHSEIKNQTDRKLALMANYRSVLSGSAAVTFTLNKMFANVVYSNRLGLLDLNKTAIPDLKSADTSYLDIYFGNVDSFVQSFHSITDSNQVGGFDMFINDQPCSFVDLQKYNLTMDKCRKLADRTMGKNVATVYRWMQFTLPYMTRLITTSNNTEKLDLLNDNKFTELNAIRSIFMVPFTEAFCAQFFVRIYSYHEYTVYLIRVKLAIYLAVSIIIAITVNAIGYRYMRKQLLTSLSSFHMLPAESAKINPQVGLILHSLH